MRRRLRIILACILAIHGQFFYAQAPTYTWQDFVDEVSNDEYADEEGWAEQMEELALLAAHPLDINTATREQLRQLPFLTDEQIEDIHTYILLHQGMRSMGELMAISSVDYRTRRYLSLFLWADQSCFERKDTLTFGSLFRKSRHEVATRIDVPLYYRIGYSYPPHRGGYHGSALYNNVRYRMTSQNHLEAGLHAEKDQGEPFRGNHGWDSYGGYATLRNVGCLRSVIIGDYKLGFGEGLVVNSGFYNGKTFQMRHSSQGIRAKRGIDEVNYFRGAAATLQYRNMRFSAWVSYRRQDASLNNDGSVKTIITDGLHRTSQELERKNNLSGIMAGGNISWQAHGFHFGATGYYIRFQRNLLPGRALYRKIYPRGQAFGVSGINYGYSHLWFSLSGETAYSTEHGGLATLNRATWKISPRYILSGSHRFYSYKYYSFYASAISENSNVQNESGGMIRLDATPVDQMNVTAYADFFYNPWPRYGMTHSSSGQEFLLQTEYGFKHNTISARYQLKRKEKSDQMETHNRLRLGYTRQQGKYWKLYSQFHLHTLYNTRMGWAVVERVRFQKSVGMLSALFSYFHAPDYDTRIFLSEPMLSDSFRFPSLYGRGIRFVIVACLFFWKGRISSEFFYGTTHYADRQTQSSGMQEIRSPWKNDISIQIRLKI